MGRPWEERLGDFPDERKAELDPLFFFSVLLYLFILDFSVWISSWSKFAHTYNFPQRSSLLKDWKEERRK